MRPYLHRSLVRALIAALLCLTCSSTSSVAHADPALRKQVDQHGDFVLFGNTLAFECDPGGTPAVPSPVVGTVGDCPDANPTAPDVYFRADDPADGQVLASSAVMAADARTTGMLVLPPDAKPTYARLYWGALLDGTAPDPSVRVERPSTGLDAMVQADASAQLQQMAGTFWYVSSADVTSLVQQQGAGPYRIGDVSSVDIVNLGSLYPFVAWYMVVFYEKADEPIRNLALFDGMDLVEFGAPRSVMLSGFLVPDSGFDAKLGVVAVEGDPLLNGDAMSFDNSVVSDMQNPADNFFNASRAYLGMPVSNVGDLPQLAGTPRSMSGIDLDVVEVGRFLTGGQSSATIEATTALDTYILTAFVTSVSTLKPDFETSMKTLEDLNGRQLLPGEELQYELTIRNSGSDASAGTLVRDPLPPGVSFVPGSIEIVSGPSMGVKTDAADGDQAEYDAATRSVVARLGTASSNSVGGSLGVNESSVLHFKVKIDPATRGPISNQAIVTASGQRGAAAAEVPTDADPTMAGAQPTVIDVDECGQDSDCKPPAALCDISQRPQVCVECVTSADCNDPAAPDCLPDTHTCGCVQGTQACEDSDGDGISDGGEETLGTDPMDADTDDDGTADGAELAPDLDSDGDGLINALDADSDNDGLFDGTEQGFDCGASGVDQTRKRCRPDADRGATKTNPTKADSDGGGVHDGSEDSDLNGAIDRGETDPTDGHGADDMRLDRDGDGLNDALEDTLHSDPDDEDTDDDGVPDGAEANPSEDTDLDQSINVLDVDSDNDGLYDGTEAGRHCADAATDTSKHHCRPDGDMGKTKTSPLVADTDRGGVNDGSEDIDGNGVLDMGELDPTVGHGADDRDATDGDRDGLSDDLEGVIGTDPNDADSDDDGVRDGAEPNPIDDQDGDGKINPLDSDSDDDGLFDGTELGFGCGEAATDLSQNQCVADADSGTTKTAPLAADTDRGGKTDGFEDFDKDGRVNTGELDPNDPADDDTPDVCETDADCGDAASGRVCVDRRCQPGCRGASGNGCPTGETCSSSNDQVGMCIAPEQDAGIFVPGNLGGGGCECRVSNAGSDAMDLRGLWLAAPLALFFTRRVRRASRRAAKPNRS